MNICFISCGRAKRHFSCRARNMYIGSIFLKSQLYAEERFDEWYILSAKHGLLNPNDKIDPYDEKLTTKNNKEWSEMVVRQIDERFKNDNLNFLCGELYIKKLFPLINNPNKKLLFDDLKMGETMEAINKDFGINDQFSGGGVISEIIFLFEQGFTRKEIIEMGFDKSTVGRQVPEYIAFKQTKMFD